MKVNVRKARQEAQKQRIEEQEGRIIEYIEALGCQFCRDLRGFGKVRLSRLVRGAYAEMMEYYEHYGGDMEKGLLPDDVPTLYVGLRNQVAALNVPVEQIEKNAELSPDFVTWRSNKDRIKRQNRYEETVRMNRMIRSYWYAMILHLWHTYGWGQVRLTKFYNMVSMTYWWVMSRYLYCKDEMDAAVLDVMNTAVAEIKEIGVEL